MSKDRYTLELTIEEIFEVFHAMRMRAAFIENIDIERSQNGDVSRNGYWAAAKATTHDVGHRVSRLPSDEDWQHFHAHRRRIFNP